MKIYITSLCFLLISSIWLSCASEKPSQTKKEQLAKASTTAISKELPVSLDHVMGKFIPAENEDFVIIDMEYASRENMYLHKDTYAAFLKMHASAKQEGINLTMVCNAQFL